MHTKQLKHFMNDIQTTEKYRMLEAEPETEYSPGGCVNMYTITTEFIIPWTHGTGSSVALLANPDGLQAQAMVSHVSLTHRCEFLIP